MKNTTLNPLLTEELTKDINDFILLRFLMSPDQREEFITKYSLEETTAIDYLSKIFDGHYFTLDYNITDDDITSVDVYSIKPGHERKLHKHIPLGLSIQFAHDTFCKFSTKK